MNRPTETKQPELVTKTCSGCGRRIRAPKRGHWLDLTQWCAARCGGRAPEAPKDDRERSTT